MLDQLTQPEPACGFQAFGMMPPCVLAQGHEGDHEDGIGGHYAQVPKDQTLIQLPGSKELVYLPQAALMFFRRLRDNTSAWWAQRLTVEEYGHAQRAIWEEAEAAGCRDEVMKLWKRANPIKASQQSLFGQQSLI